MSKVDVKKVGASFKDAGIMVGGGGTTAALISGANTLINRYLPNLPLKEFIVPLGVGVVTTYGAIKAKNPDVKSAFMGGTIAAVRSTGIAVKNKIAPSLPTTVNKALDTALSGAENHPLPGNRFPALEKMLPSETVVAEEEVTASLVL